VARGRQRLSPLELALLACIVGIALAVFTPTFLRRVRTNKILEASELLQDLHDRTAAYYETSWSNGLRHCLPPRAGPTPQAPHVEPESVDFASSSEVWAALDFEPDRPIRFSYEYLPSEVGCDLDSDGSTPLVIFRATGDLDGDGVWSRFERSATATDEGTLEPTGALHVYRRVE
jgi:hypothetical protein